MTDLTGKRVAFVATNGFEDSELFDPWTAVTSSGATAVLVSTEAGTITGKNGGEAEVGVTTAEADAGDYDALVLPGGVVNSDDIRLDADAVALVKALVTAAKPVGVICHGAWILADADVLRGRTITSFPTLRTDLTNAGATWVDEEVVCDQGLVSSRTPKDLPAFNDKLVEEIAEGVHPQREA
ncbi:type 1 glutamine amidotransferase domain-containing protein [Litorihabitans aurantiacus]|uniref:Protease n=1 Tax=Litorihabitans aurantiacus TaxID=1930061 RepID=A0AA37XHX0_9MICO|nr:type 1 glutamine amidotransferase domain-containing protein [Litorihabitans aurantiacus]GMA30044.1 protease [Litorihabitans aurantiacus]GMA33543.1 protease [Litorihabitans aurantiacus]